jgi:ribosome maturation factor RimP
MELKEHLVTIVEKNLPSQDYFLVDIILKGSEQQRKVIVLLDGDNGITIDACAKVSRALGVELEEDDLFPGRYTLEVSSTGLDYPLVLHRQYMSRIGKLLDLTLTDGTVLKGKLLKVNDNEIIIDSIIKNKKKQTTEETTVSFARIEKAMVLVSFK